MRCGPWKGWSLIVGQLAARLGEQGSALDTADSCTPGDGPMHSQNCTSRRFFARGDSEPSSRCCLHIRQICLAGQGGESVLASTLSIIQIFSYAMTVSTVAPALATMIGLGVGIGYARFLVTNR